MNLAIRLSGIPYLNKENVGTFFSEPFIYIFLILFVLLFLAFLQFQTAGLYYAMRASCRDEKAELHKMLWYGLRQTVRLLRPANFPAFVYLFFSLPIMGTVVYSFQLLNFRLPKYISGFFEGEKWLTIGLWVGYIVLSLLALFFLFSMMIFLEKRKRFVHTLKESRSILKRKIYRFEPLRVFLFGAFLLLLMFLMDFLLSKGSLYLMKWVPMTGNARFLFVSVVGAVRMALYLIFTLTGLPIYIAFFSNSYLRIENQEQINEEREVDREEQEADAMKERAIVALLIGICIVINVTFFSLRRKGLLSLDMEYLNTVTVTAHRGANREAPENTLSAFDAAVNAGADVVELDVRQTADGVVVVSHDASLARTAKEKIPVGKSTYEELKKYNVGAYFKDGSFEEHVPTLEEAILLLDGRADLNIELKPEGTDQNLEEEVVRLVREYDLVDRCVVTSQNYMAISKVKSLDPEIRTVYVMSVAGGKFYELKSADAFSLKADYINLTIVRAAHSHGKQVYAWVINDDERLEDMMLLGVDSIITDQPLRMKEKMLEIYQDGTVLDLLQSLLGNLL